MLRKFDNWVKCHMLISMGGHLCLKWRNLKTTWKGWSYRGIMFRIDSLGGGLSSWPDFTPDVLLTSRKQFLVKKQAFEHFSTILGCCIAYTCSISSFLFIALHWQCVTWCSVILIFIIGSSLTERESMHICFLYNIYLVVLTNGCAQRKPFVPNQKIILCL